MLNGGIALSMILSSLISTCLVSGRGLNTKEKSKMLLQDFVDIFEMFDDTPDDPATAGQSFGLTFIGKGYGDPDSRVSAQLKYGLDLSGCFSWCSKIREEQGTSYNGLWYFKGLGQCGCVKGDSGHVASGPIVQAYYNQFLHYRWE